MSDLDPDRFSVRQADAAREDYARPRYGAVGSAPDAESPSANRSLDQFNRVRARHCSIEHTQAYIEGDTRAKRRVVNLLQGPAPELL